MKQLICRSLSDAELPDHRRLERDPAQVAARGSGRVYLEKVPRFMFLVSGFPIPQPT
jgi:hypothetical protein